MSLKKSNHFPHPGDASILPPKHNHWLAVARSNWFIVLIFLLYPIGQFVQDEDRFNPYWAQIICKVGIYILLALGLQLINGISGQFSLGHAGFMAIGAYASATAIDQFSYLGAAETANQLTPVAARYTNPGKVLVFFLLLCAGMVLFISFCELLKFIKTNFDREAESAISRASTRKYRLTLFILAMISVISIVIARQHIDPIGDSITSFVPTNLRPPFCMIIILVGSGILAGFAGWLVGLPTLRLRGDYLAIATLGFAEIVQVVIANTKYLGSSTGLQLTPYSILPDTRRDAPATGYFYLFPWIYGSAFLAFMLLYRLKSSAKGLAIQSVREDEIAARAVGVDNVHHKIIAFVIGAALAGVGGALLANNIGYINTATFSLQTSVEIVVIVTLGGLGNIYGTVIAAVALTLLPEWLRDPTFRSILDPDGDHSEALNLEKWRMVIYAVILICIMLLRNVAGKAISRVYQQWFASKSSTNKSVRFSK